MHAAIVFLELNGSEIELDPDEAERLVLGVVSGRVTKDDVAAFFRRYMHSSQG